jgi:hypothetical protein
MQLEAYQFNWRAALEQADRILSAPPVKAHSERPAKLLDRVVFRAAFPSELCLPANKMARRGMANANWKFAAIKRDLWSLLSIQSSGWVSNRPHWPVRARSDGIRPQVLACKFSSRAPDVGANVAKAPIDMLTLPRMTRCGMQQHRLGLIDDDRPECVQQLHWWEFLPRAERAFVLVEVRI